MDFFIIKLIFVFLSWYCVIKQTITNIVKSNKTK